MTICIPLVQTLSCFDADGRSVTALHLEVKQPVHQHRKGQLILALHGGVTCKVSKAMWMVLPHHAV